MAAVAKFYRGDYILGNGYPFALVLASQVDGDAYIGEAFLIVQRLKPNRKLEVESYHRLGYRQSTATFESLGVKEPQRFIIEDGLNAIRYFTSEMRLAFYEKMKLPAALNETNFVEEPDWQQSMLRLRLAGFPESDLIKMAKQVADEEVGGYLNQLRNVQPIEVEKIWQSVAKGVSLKIEVLGRSALRRLVGFARRKTENRLPGPNPNSAGSWGN